MCIDSQSRRRRNRSSTVCAIYAAEIILKATMTITTLWFDNDHLAASEADGDCGQSKSVEWKKLERPTLSKGSRYAFLAFINIL
jgi:hypothetical protein